MQTFPSAAAHKGFVRLKKFSSVTVFYRQTWHTPALVFSSLFSACIYLYPDPPTLAFLEWVHFVLSRLSFHRIVTQTTTTNGSARKSSIRVVCWLTRIRNPTESSSLKRHSNSRKRISKDEVSRFFSRQSLFSFVDIGKLCMYYTHISAWCSIGPSWLIQKKKLETSPWP